ncbi:hypothetical protein KKJ09_19980 [Xenorhabdus bovienii]|uniref:hypothetical protein n=1 Tax=Xenorhabdus bovienii TaxID=40576 RepID=UPI0023B2818A|nr:hypothetical protein [Xenorhabdus bovienii]MDE9495796.1 hypothetical protein [Xenorhabdus bovienii]MDE9503832.1 hypothetical protein [Xenorhabdus bovienii]MDE9527599.1 hypothetical protein [Xenorhabdus bovienii]MDE9570820.1 hypothetical protein [Xenorhabdus bovienii]
MSYLKCLNYFGASFFLFSVFVQAQSPSSQLSTSQQKYLQQQIDKQMTDKSAAKEADKVFLGDESPNSIRLIDSRLIGTGMYRQGFSWKNIRFSCELDPKTGEARSFKLLKALPPQLQTGPGPVILPKKGQ